MRACVQPIFPKLSADHGAQFCRSAVVHPLASRNPNVASSPGHPLDARLPAKTVAFGDAFELAQLNV